jgi:hypothetical protein
MTHKVKYVTFIGDVHGLTTWEIVVKRALADYGEVVFLGDYVDSFFVKPANIMTNLLKIIEWKQKYPNKITLLMGNHDWAYYRMKPGISGYQHGAADNYHDIFIKNRDIFDMAWGYTSDFRLNPQGKPLYTLATHAGLSETYYNYLLERVEKEKAGVSEVLRELDYKNMPLHEFLNFFKDSENSWKVGVDRGGWGCGGILWADKREVKEDPYPGIDQVAGHTPHHSIEIAQRNGNMLYFIDQYGNDTLFWAELEL